MDGWTEWTGAWREGWGVGLVWDNGQDRRVVSGRRHGGQGQLGRWKEGAGAAGGAGGKVEQRAGRSLGDTSVETSHPLVSDRALLRSGIC